MVILTDYTKLEVGVHREEGPGPGVEVQEEIDGEAVVAADHGIEVVAGVAVEGGTEATTEIVVVLVVIDIGIDLPQEIDHGVEVRIRNSGIYQSLFQWNILALPVG